MERDFEILDKYKDYKLYRLKDGGIVWADNAGWLGCSFDSEETAKYFIDRKKLFTDNFYNIINESQVLANKENNGYVSIEIINRFETIR